MSEYRKQMKLMGSAFELIIAGESAEKAEKLLNLGIKEIERLESLLTEFRDSSVTSSINRMAGISAVQVPDEVYQLIIRCQRISNLTQGAFDISIKPLKYLYDFKGKELRLPSQRQLKSALNKTGYQNIRLLKDNRIYLTKKGMEISFASIGKGYAADEVKKLWIKKGVQNGVVNASGDLSVIGTKAENTPWKAGIADPINPVKTILNIPLNQGSIATSGNYEQYFDLQGERYSHTLDPITGLPVRGIKSVSVQGHSAELCDALATAVTVMGVDIGIHLIDQLPDTHCLIIDEKNQIHFSKSIKFDHQ